MKMLDLDIYRKMQRVGTISAKEEQEFSQLSCWRQCETMRYLAENPVQRNLLLGTVLMLVPIRYKLSFAHYFGALAVPFAFSFIH